MAVTLGSWEKETDEGEFIGKTQNYLAVRSLSHEKGLMPAKESQMKVKGFLASGELLVTS